MKLTIQTKLLQSALASLRSIAKASTVVPILSNVQLTAVDNTLILRGMDLEKELIVTIPANVFTEGSTTLPCARLCDLMASRSALETSLTTDTKHVTVIKSGSSTGKIMGLDPAEMPPGLNCEEDVEIKLAVSEFNCAMSGALTHAHTDKNGKKALLCSVWLVAMDGKLRIQATNGQRIFFYDTESDFSTKGHFVIPRDSVPEMVKIASDGDVTVRLSSGIMTVESEDVKFSTRLIEARFIDFNRQLPKVESAKSTIVMNRADFLSVVAYVDSITPPDRRQSTLCAKDGSVTLSGVNAQDSAEDVVDANLSGPITLSLNPGYIKDALKLLSEQEVTIYCGDSIAPILITEGPISTVICPFHLVP